MICFVLFLALIKKEFWGTFISSETGNEWAQNKLLKSKTDLEKADMLTVSKKKWKTIEGEAKEWVQDNWEVWEDEQPEWFTEVWKSRIPDDWLSAAELRKQKMAGGGQRRKSSVFGELAGSSVRERRASSAVAPEPTGEDKTSIDDEGGSRKEVQEL